MTVAMYRSQLHARRGQWIDTEDNRELAKPKLADGEVKLDASFLATAFDGFHSLSLLVESKVSLSSWFHCVHIIYFI